MWKTLENLREFKSWGKDFLACGASVFNVVDTK